MNEFINKITCGDLLGLLKQLPDNSIDVFFADPPFNLKKKYSKYKDSIDKQEYLEWSYQWLKEAIRITKPTGSIFIHNIPVNLIPYAKFMSDNAHFKHWISWDAPTSPMGKSLQPGHYGILFYCKDPLQTKFYEIRYPHKRMRKYGILAKDYGGKKKLLHPFGPLVSDVWTDIFRVKHNKYRDGHPCQLPVHLLERIILMSSDEGDIVLDPFMGTGTTAIAAKRLGRKYIGFEIDKTYIDIADKKLSQENALSKINECYVSIYNDSITTIRDQDWKHLQQYFEMPANAADIETKQIKLKPDFVF